MTSECKSLSVPNTYYKFWKLEQINSILNSIDETLECHTVEEKVDCLALTFQLKDSSKRKKIERVFSRIALYDILTLSGMVKKKKGSLDLIYINEKFQLEKIPQIQCSLSHSKDLFCCIVSANSNFVFGIDIEPRTRIISSNSKRLFSNQLDQTSNKDLLYLWVQKEAAYKAIYHVFFRNNVKNTNSPPPKGLHEITVKFNQFTYHEMNGELINLSTEDFICFVAQISII